ncbi:MAG: AMP-binding protein, partial [Methyloligellaceae bacterium]
MRGLIQDRQLLISSLLGHAAEYHREGRITSVMDDGSMCRHSYPELAQRTAQLAHALTKLGVEPADRIATLAWNHHRHFELYYAISGIGAVVHTINPRLFPEQIGYIVNHARDRWLCVDPGFLPILEGLIDEIAETILGVVVLADVVPETPLTARTTVLAYEELIGPEPKHFDWPEFDETTACGLCYTSGTTGPPKGTLYSHRSTVLHAWSICLPDL